MKLKINETFISEINEMDYINDQDVEEIINPGIGEENENETGSEDETSSDEDLIEGSHQICIFRSEQAGSIFCGSLNGNGTLAVTGGIDDRGYIWCTETKNVLYKCTDHTDSVIFAEFNHNDTYVATGDMNGIIQLWNLSENAHSLQFKMPNDMTWMKWHHSLDVILAGSESGEIYMWPVPEGPLKIFPGNGNSVEVAVLSPDGLRLAVGYKDGTIHVLNLNENTIQSSISRKIGHREIITSIDYHANNNLLISASVDCRVILSTPSNGKVVHIFEEISSLNHDVDSNVSLDAEDESNMNWVESVAFCKDPILPVIAAATIKGEIFIWDIPKKCLRHKLNMNDTAHGISKLLWKGNTSIFFVAGLDSMLRCLDAKTGNCLETFKGHKNHILDVHISRDEKKVLTTSDDGTARIFDISFIT